MKTMMATKTMKIMRIKKSIRRTLIVVLMVAVLLSSVSVVGLVTKNNVVYAGEPVYGFYVSGFYGSDEQKIYEKKARNSDGSATFDIEFYFNAPEGWEDDIEFDISDVTPAPYANMFASLGIKKQDITVETGFEPKYAEGGVQRVIRPFPEGKTYYDNPVYATGGLRIRITVGYTTRAIKIIARKKSTVLDTMYVVIPGYTSSGTEIALDGQFYREVLSQVEAALWTNGMSNEEKIVAIVNYIKNTTHSSYGEPDSISKEANYEYWKKWSVDGAFLYYSRAFDKPLDKIMRLQGGIRPFGIIDMVLKAAEEDLGLRNIYDSKGDTTLDEEGVWTDDWNSILYYKRPDLSVVEFQMPGFSTACEEHQHSCEKIVKLHQISYSLVGIQINKPFLYLDRGDSETLKVTPRPIFADIGALTWTSGNTSVAVVDASGKVTGKKAGKAIITAYTADGKKQTCIVGVSDSITSLEIVGGGKHKYTGTWIEPEVVVKDSMGNTVPSSGYTVEYSDNINVGKAGITVTGRGYYTGTISKTFEIVEKTEEENTEPGYTGLKKQSDGKYYLYKDGKFQSSYSGLYKNSKGKYVVIKNGIWAQDHNGLYKSPATGKTVYITNGYLDNKVTKLVQNSKGNWLYIKDGHWYDTYNGLYKNQSGKYVVIKNGIWQKSYNGLYKSPATGKVLYITNGYLDTSVTKLVKNSKGNWLYIKDGHWYDSYNGFYKNQSGKYVVIKKGVWQKNYNGLYQSPKTGTLAYVKDGAVDTSATRLVQNSKGKYLLIKGGYWQKTYTGKWKSPSTGKEYNIVNGVAQF